MNLPPIEDRMRTLLKLIAVEVRTCKLCPATIYMVQHNNGKIAPYTESGVNHFLDCPNAPGVSKAEELIARFQPKPNMTRQELREKVWSRPPPSSEALRKRAERLERMRKYTREWSKDLK
jgi:hypothetical protein